ncbi:MAG: ABC transporter ATP-binding protein [Bacilli bacterium]|nr:ABC transporter ATP-binding protein [Bacilli bacterium]
MIKMKIEVKNLSKSFKDISIINNINIKFESGNIYGLYGRNGSGKSVFLKLICGFYRPTEGEILYDGINLDANLKFPQNLRALIEKPSFFPELTGYENLKLLAQIQNKISDKEILESLETVNLIQEKDKKFSKYSLGMKQKLGIAQAIMENPDIIILDEPFNGVEQVSVEKIINYLKNEKMKNKIIIFCTHIKEDLDKLADKIYYFDNGCIYDKEI